MGDKEIIRLQHKEGRIMQKDCKFTLHGHSQMCLKADWLWIGQGVTHSHFWWCNGGFPKLWVNRIWLEWNLIRQGHSVKIYSLPQAIGLVLHALGQVVKAPFKVLRASKVEPHEPESCSLPASIICWVGTDCDGRGHQRRVVLLVFHLKPGCRTIPWMGSLMCVNTSLCLSTQTYLLEILGFLWPVICFLKKTPYKNRTP